MGKQSTKAEDGFSIDFAAKRLDNARKNMEEAEGTKNHPRMMIEHDIASLHYQLALMRDTREKEMQMLRAAREENESLQAELRSWHAWVEGLPNRLMLLEGAYAGLSNMAMGGLSTNKLIEAYELGQKRPLTPAAKTE